MGIDVLGPVTVEDEAGILGPRDRVVLAALSLRPGESVSSERLADALWGEGPPATWTKVVQGCVTRLRKVLGPAAIETGHQGYRLALPIDDVDAQRFERLVTRGRELLTLGEPERAAHVVGEALALWRGRALVDLEGWSPAEAETARLEEMRLEAQEVLLDAELQAGRHSEVLADLQARVTEQPLRERRWGLLALAQYQTGRQGEALRTLHRARMTLAGELGLDPGPDLVALEAAILRQDPSLVADAALPEPSAACPYLGLVAYDMADAEAFFGRDEDVAACVRRLASVGVLAVVGPSGCGKSSLVRAGVAAALRRDGRQVVVVTPGAHPCAALTDLPDVGRAPVLVVDQCEEAVVLCDDAGEQASFFAALAAHAERGPLVVALRADRLGELSAHPDIVRVIEPALYLLGAMGEAGLRAAIVGPARQAGLLLEPGLVELLVREVEGEPGALPLLSHALVTTWDRRDHRTLTVEGYRAAGGIRGAVAQSAEDLYEDVPPDQRPLLRDLLLRLVTPAAYGEPVRSRAPRRTVVTDPAHEALVERLVAARLVTSDDGVVELAHEALVRAWPRLRGWLDDDVEGQRILRHLAGAADMWDAMGRPDSELYRGARLVQAIDWRDRNRPDLTPTERAFLGAGQALAETEREAVARQAQQQARVNRRLRSQLAVIAIFLVVSLVVGAVAVAQRGHAERASRAAEARELAAAANANADVDPDRSILLALAAADRARTAGDSQVLSDTEEALHRAVSASRVERRVPGEGGRLDWSPDGTLFATEGPRGAGVVDLRDARTGRTVRSVRRLEGDVNDLAFGPGGTLATVGSDGAAQIWDVTSGAQLHSVVYPSEYGAWGPSFSADGALFAAAWTADGVVVVLDVATGIVVRQITAVPEPGRTSFDPSGTRIAIGAARTPTAMVVDIATGDALFALEGHRGSITDVAWSPDGRSIATASTDGSTRIHDAATGALRFALPGGGHVYDVDWSPDATRLVTADGDGAARLWLLADGGPREEFTLASQDTRNGVAGVAFSPDGTRVLTGDFGITAAQIWDVGVAGDAEIANLPAVAGTPDAVAFTADGRRLVATGAAGTAVVWDAQTYAPLRTLGGADAPGPAPVGGEAVGPAHSSGGDVYSIAVSPDGRLVAGARLDGPVQVWDARTGRDAMTVDSSHAMPGLPYTHVMWDPAGERLAIAENNGSTGRVSVVDRSGRRVAALPVGPRTAVGSVAFSPEGDRLITTQLSTREPDAMGGQVVIWDWRARTVERVLDIAGLHAALSPTGDMLAVVGFDQGPLPGGSVEVWNPITGRRITRLEGATGVVTVAFSTDGSRLATAGHDGTVRIWDPTSGEQLLVLRGHDASVDSLAFSPDGSRLASAGEDGVVRVWALDLDDLVRIAEHQVTRRLTDEECRQYLHLRRCR